MYILLSKKAVIFVLFWPFSHLYKKRKKKKKKRKEKKIRPRQTERLSCQISILKKQGNFIKSTNFISMLGWEIQSFRKIGSERALC